MTLFLGPCRRALCPLHLPVGPRATFAIPLRHKAKKQPDSPLYQKDRVQPTVQGAEMAAKATRAVVAAIRPMPAD